MSRLVDSRDIAELQLKQMDCEILIRKKEALPQPSVPAPVFFTPPYAHQSILPPQLLSESTPAPAPVVSAPSSPTSPQALPAPTKPKLSHPPFKCPMAGNFYHSSAPGSPPFVKVCIIYMLCIHKYIYIIVYYLNKYTDIEIPCSCH